MDYSPILDLISEISSQREANNRQMNYYLNDGTPYSNPNIPEQIKLAMYEMQVLDKEKKRREEEINRLS